MVKALLTVITAITMQQEKIYQEANKTVDHTASPELPACCGTGCAVCVLDYPELFSNQQADDLNDTPGDPEMLAMLEAIEQAQSRATQIIAETGKLQ